MPEIEAYVFFNGNCAEALRFYERMLGAKIEMMMTYGESPEQCEGFNPPPDKIMHARLVVGNTGLMASDDVCGEKPYEGMKGFSLSLSYETAEEAQKIYNTLADGGQALMPFGPTFWSEGFGMVVDRFGTPWMVGGGFKM